MNAYITLDDLKTALSIEDDGDDAELRRVIEEVSRKIDGYCRRCFYSLTDVRHVSGNGRGMLLLPDDLIAVTTLKEDESRTGAYGTTWATTDYELGPYDADPTGPAGRRTTRPYSSIEINERSNGTKGFFGTGQKRFEITGKWGYSESTRASGSALNGALTASATSVAVDEGAHFEVLQTILAGAEQMYVTAIEGNILTVERGVNGTTAASHDDDSAVSIIEYPPDVVAATLIEASRRWQMRQAHFSSQVGVPETGEVRILGGGLRNETKEHLSPYVDWVRSFA